MQITKKYHFYAAHRNQELGDKCRNIHGHRYLVFCTFELERTGHITTLFADLDTVVEPILKGKYDHGMIIDRNDPLYPYIKQYETDTGDMMKMVVFDYPTSVENLSFKLFEEIRAQLPLVELRVQETETSTVVYTLTDYNNDKQHYA